MSGKIMKMAERGLRDIKIFTSSAYDPQMEVLLNSLLNSQA